MFARFVGVAQHGEVLVLDGFLLFGLEGVIVDVWLIHLEGFCRLIFKFFDVSVYESPDKVEGQLMDVGDVLFDLRLVMGIVHYHVCYVEVGWIAHMEEVDSVFMDSEFFDQRFHVLHIECGCFLSGMNLHIKLDFLESRDVTQI